MLDKLWLPTQFRRLTSYRQRSRRELICTLTPRPTYFAEADQLLLTGQSIMLVQTLSWTKVMVNSTMVIVNRQL